MMTPSRGRCPLSSLTAALSVSPTTSTCRSAQLPGHALTKFAKIIEHIRAGSAALEWSEPAGCNGAIPQLMYMPQVQRR